MGAGQAWTGGVHSWYHEKKPEWSRVDLEIYILYFALDQHVAMSYYTKLFWVKVVGIRFCHRQTNWSKAIAAKKKLYRGSSRSRQEILEIIPDKWAWCPCMEKSERAGRVCHAPLALSPSIRQLRDGRKEDADRPISISGFAQSTFLQKSFSTSFVHIPLYRITCLIWNCGHGER